MDAHRKRLVSVILPSARVVRRGRRLSCAGAGLAVVVLAMGGCGRTELDLTGLPGRDAGAASGGRDAGRGQDAGGIGTGGRGTGGGLPNGTGGRVGTGGTPGPGTGGAAAGGRAGTGGRSGTGGAAVDGGTRDGGPATDARDGGLDLPPSTPGTFTCGTETCSTATQTCCVSVAVGSVGAHCVPMGTACTGASLSCDEPADCTAGVCCFGLQVGGGGLSVGSRCTPRAACAGIGRFVLCRSNADCAGATPICCNTNGVPICQAAACPGG